MTACWYVATVAALAVQAPPDEAGDAVLKAVVRRAKDAHGLRAWEKWRYGRLVMTRSLLTDDLNVAEKLVDVFDRTTAWKRHSFMGGKFDKAAVVTPNGERNIDWQGTESTIPTAPGGIPGLEGEVFPAHTLLKKVLSPELEGAWVLRREAGQHGEETDVVEFTSPASKDKKLRWVFRRDTGLLYAVEIRNSGEPDPRYVVNSHTFSDYKTWNGVTMPTRVVIRHYPVKMMLVIQSVDVYDSLDKKVFELPKLP